MLMSAVFVRGSCRTNETEYGESRSVAELLFAEALAMRDTMALKQVFTRR
jgi:hypothetical protein